MGTRISVGAALAAALLLTGCSGGEPDADPPPAPASSGESSPTPSSTATSTASASPEESASPSVAPATGETVRMSAFTLRAPEGWPVGDVAGPFVDFELLPKGGGIGKRAYGAIFLTSFPSVREKTLEEEAREAQGRRQDDVTIAGEPAYHVVRPQAGPYTSETFGLNRDSTSISFDFALFGGSEQQRQELIASVLASVEWR